ncbi:dihydrofolate reductase [Paenibacillus sp. 481]|uniref:dihydrofolate reductase n=1 Tax=Paenibacillus sp. 481 TaxID=2835869 RepID=UPI001E3D5A7C|nr:dihydrofolate reductase [Paenibacillus sp. 481]UHA73124.1 dihydrofolate reductase [Paenibacillus sp. 481]
MPITMIWAMDKQRIIGKDNTLPWHLPNDLAYFRKQTLGKTVVMGRRTFESFGKALPKRRNLVLTRNSNWSVPDAEVIFGIDDVLALAPNEEVMIIGGAQIYDLFMEHADQLLVTEIEEEFEGEDYFPPYDESLWELVSEVTGEVDEKNRYAHRFLTYRRKSTS